MFKVNNNVAPPIIDDLFTRSHHSCNLRSKPNFVVAGVCVVRNGQNSVQYYGPLIWNMIPDYIKDSNTLDIFKNKIKKGKPINCPCRLSKKYISILGFVINVV